MIIDLRFWQIHAMGKSPHSGVELLKYPHNVDEEGDVPPMNVFARIRSLKPITLGFGVLGFLLAYKTISDFDVPWHMAAGRWMWEHGRVPVADPFPSISQGEPWMSITWAYELVLYLLSRTGM